MNTGLRLSFRRGDWLAILLVAALAVCTAAAFAAGGGEQSGTVQVFRDGRLVRELPLDRDERFAVEGQYRNTVTVEGGRVSITDSDCPGRDCVHSGWISSAGHSVVCLPNRVEVRVTGQSDVDFTVR